MISEEDVLSSDKALQYVGGYGKFQILALIIVVLSFSSGGQIAYALPYLESRSISMECTYFNATSSICDPSTACNKNVTASYSYIHDSDVSLQNWVVSFDLACESQGQISWLSTFFFAGFLAGSAIFLALADKIGRKPITLIGLIVHLALNISINYISSYGYLVAYVILFGLRVPMASHVPYMILMELVSPKYRSQFSLMVNGIDGFANIFIALGFKYLQNWRTWFLINDIEVALIFIVILVFLPESPRYLISTGRFNKARKVFQYVAHINKKPMFPHKLEGELEGALSASHTSSSDVVPSPLSSQTSSTRRRRTKLCALCRRSVYDRLLLSAVFFIWFCVDIVHYGIGFGLNELSGDIYTNGMLLGAADLISCVSISFLANRIGRKKSILLTWGCATVGCLVYDFIRSYSVPSYIAVTVARFGSIGCFALIFLITSETFPTEVRGIIFGISNATARFGGLAAPLISSYIYHFMLILGSMAFLSFLAALILRETLGKKMEDSIQGPERGRAYTVLSD